MDHPDCALRRGGGRLFSCRRTEVNAALAILKHVVRTPGERTGCGSGQPLRLNCLPVGGLGAKVLRISAAIGSANAISFALLSAVRSPSAPQSCEGETQRGSRANQSGRTIYVARPVNPRQRERERAEQLSCRYDTDWTCGTQTQGWRDFPGIHRQSWPLNLPHFHSSGLKGWR